MKGTLLQLIAKGSEDINITGDPEISFFENVYKRYTPFSMESIENPINTIPRFGSTIKVKIEKFGDLLSKMYLNVTLPGDNVNNGRWTNRVGFNLIRKIELIIGNTVVDKQDGLFMYLQSELNSSDTKKSMLDTLVGHKANFPGQQSFGNLGNNPIEYQIPLNFFFCKNYSHCLPLIAMTKQDIYLKIYFQSKSNCLQSGTILGELSEVKLWVDYIFLSHTEKSNFANNNYQYLIEVTQHKTLNLTVDGISNIRIPFKLPCKELIWIVRRITINDTTDKFTDFTTGIANIQQLAKSMVRKCQLKVNSKNVLSSGYRNFDYFNYIMPYQYHSGCPDLGINVYSFCLKPEDINPTGFLDIGKIDNFNLLVDSSIGILHIYALSYNLLEIDDEFVSLKNIY